MASNRDVVGVLVHSSVIREDERRVSGNAFDLALLVQFQSLNPIIVGLIRRLRLVVLGSGRVVEHGLAVLVLGLDQPCRFGREAAWLDRSLVFLVFAKAEENLPFAASATPNLFYPAS
jgi:hypothetical protein